MSSYPPVNYFNEVAENNTLLWIVFFVIVALILIVLIVSSTRYKNRNQNSSSSSSNGDNTFSYSSPNVYSGSIPVGTTGRMTSGDGSSMNTSGTQSSVPPTMPSGMAGDDVPTFTPRSYAELNNMKVLENNKRAMSIGGPASVATLGTFPIGNMASAYDHTYPNNGIGNAPIIPSGPSVMNLMPGSWRGNCPPTEEDGYWGRFAPTKEAFDKYITVSGSSRLQLNTRIKNPTGGIPNSLRASPPVPISGKALTFLDSSHRLDLIYNSTGVYPTTDAC